MCEQGRLTLRVQLAFPHFPVPGAHPVSPSSRLYLLDYFPGSSGDTAPEYVGLIPKCHLLGHMPLLQGTHWPVCPQGRVFIPQIRKLRPSEAMHLAQGHRASHPQSPGLHSGLQVQHHHLSPCHTAPYQDTGPISYFAATAPISHLPGPPVPIWTCTCSQTSVPVWTKENWVTHRGGARTRHA